MDSRPYDIPLVSGNKGRKRSRREEEVDLEGPNTFAPTATPASSPEAHSGIPIPKPLMPLPNKETSEPPNAGTWKDEPMELNNPSSTQQESSDSSLPSENSLAVSHDSLDQPRKASRRDLGQLDQSISPRSSSQTTSSEIDPYKRALGVGWDRIEANGPANAAMRGYETFIEKEYPFKGSKIVAQDRGQLQFLVTCDKGWMLFEDDLKRAMELGDTFENAVERYWEEVKGNGVGSGVSGKIWQAGEDEPQGRSSGESEVAGRMELD